MRRKRTYEGESGGTFSADESRFRVGRLAAEAREEASRRVDYREASLKLHGLICAKCAREFSPRDSHLLTVHHKDGNWRNNPLDGSNWENLCVYCHDDEHARGG
jgi:5-methylcytosine-specific restriction endonuclease McrA